MTDDNMSVAAGPDRSRHALAHYLQAAGLEYELCSAKRDSRAGLPGGGSGGGRADAPQFVVTLPGTAKLRTNVALTIGTTSIIVNAFVCRAPAENQEQVYRLILRRNPRLYAVAFGLDRLGDIYLTGHIPHAAVSESELDRVLGVVLAESDGMFNQLVRIGFATAIERERQWRARRGMDDANLRALEGDLDEDG